MRWIGKTFLQGLALVLPLGLTAWALTWAFLGSERLLGSVVRWVLPESWYVPGLGILVAVVLVFGIGLLTRIWLVRLLVTALERLVARLPVVKTVHGTLRDLVRYVVRSGKEAGHEVVMLSLGDGGPDVLGFVTRDDVSELGVGPAGDRVAVYLPMSYQVGGYTVLVSRERLKPVRLTRERAFSFIITAGVERGETPAR